MGRIWNTSVFFTLIGSIRLPCRMLVPTALLVFLTSCAEPVDDSPHSLSTIDITTAKAEIDNVREQFELALTMQDLEALGQIVYDDTIFVPPGGDDWQAMLATAEGAPFPAGYRLDIAPMELEIINSEWAYEFGTSIATYTPEAGADPVHVRDTYLILLRNTGDGWKPYREVASSSPPPSGWPVE